MDTKKLTIDEGVTEIIKHVADWNLLDFETNFEDVWLRPEEGKTAKTVESWLPVVTSWIR